MRKLIKRYLYGGEYAMSKGLNYPNTTNVGAIDWSNASAFQKNKIAELPSSGEQKLTPESLGDLSIFNKGNGFLSKLGGGISNILGKAGGLGGVASVLGGIGESLLPKRITSKGMDIANGILGAAENIPVYGKFATLAKFGINLIDSLGATKLDSVVNSLEAKEALAATGGGYGDFMLDWDEASELSGQRAGLFTSKSALNEKIHNANRLMSLLQRITGRKRLDDLLTALMGDRWNLATMNLLNGGFENISFGRLGLKVEVLPKVHAILNKPKVVDTLTEWEEETPIFKEGGKMNVIPEGHLHARLHHMENADNLTKKGVPVVSIAEGGELELQAEIELNEIIFRLEVTKELEKLMEDGSDNAAIEAGKMLVKEIFENTDDRTGLLKDLEPDKKEPTTEDIVKNHQVFQEGGKL